MITNVSDAFRLAIENSRSDYNVRIMIQKAGTESAEPIVAFFDTSDIWMDGITIEDSFAVNGDMGIGGCVINQATLTLLKASVREHFTLGDLNGAAVQIFIGFDGIGMVEKFNGTVYKVTEAAHLLTLTVYDAMYKLDTPIAENYAKSAIIGKTLGEVAADIAQQMAVRLDTTTFLNSTYVVKQAIDPNATTYRMLLSWVAQMAGGFARVNRERHLEIVEAPLRNLFYAARDLDPAITEESFSDPDFFDSSKTPNFYDATDGVALIHSTFSREITARSVSIGDVIIGIKNKTAGDDSTYTYYASGAGSSNGVQLIIKDNGLIAAVDATAVALDIYLAIASTTYYIGNITHIANPLMEAGDPMFLLVGNDRYPMIVSSTAFSPGKSQTTGSYGLTAEQTAATQYSQSDVNYSDTKSMLSEIATTDSWTETNTTYDIIISAKKRNGTVMLYLHVSSTSTGLAADIASSNAYVTLGTLPEGYRPAISYTSYHILNGTMRGQIIVNTNGTIRVGYTRALTATSNSNMTAGMLFYADTTFVTA